MINMSDENKRVVKMIINGEEIELINDDGNDSSSVVFGIDFEFKDDKKEEDFLKTLNQTKQINNNTK